MRLSDILEDVDVETPDGEFKPVSFKRNKNDDYDIEGSFDKWTEENYERFQDEEFIKRLEKVFNKLPYDIKILVFNRKDAGFSARRGNKSWPELKLSKKLTTGMIGSIVNFFTLRWGQKGYDIGLGMREGRGPLKKSTAKYINKRLRKGNLVLVVGSDALIQDRVDLTPWGISHGLAHAIEAEPIRGKRNFGPRWSGEIFVGLSDIAKNLCEVYGIQNTHIAYTKYSDPASIWEYKYSDVQFDSTEEFEEQVLPTALLNHLFPFSSARNNQVVHGMEYSIEIAVNCLFKNGITLNKNLPESIEGYTPVNMDAYKPELIQELEDFINSNYQHFWEQPKGKIAFLY